MSAAERVAHAAQTVVASWERGVKVDPATDAVQALEDTCQLQDPETAAELRRLEDAVPELTARLARLGAAQRIERIWYRHRTRMERRERERADRLAAELKQARAQVAALLAERKSTNALLLDVTVAMRAAEAGQAPSPGLASEESVQLLRDGIAAAQERGTVVVADVYPPALPWAKWLDEDDLPDFLDELAAAAIVNASSAEALAEVEATCATWRVIAEATRAHLTALGPNCRCEEPVLECTGEGCGCPVCHRAVVPAADVPVPYVPVEVTASVTSYADQAAAAMLRRASDGGEQP